MGLSEAHDVRYPNIRVVLIGKDGNIFNLMGIVKRELREQGVSREHIARFQQDVMASENYDDALKRIQEWVMIE